MGGLLEDAKGAYRGDQTFIRAAYDRFKAEWRTRKEASEYVQEWFPGYPLKHRRQELAEVWERRKEVVPPRWRGRNRAARKSRRLSNGRAGQMAFGI